MTAITNFYDLQRLHEDAKAGGRGSKAYFAFADAMFESLPLIVDTARQLHARTAELQENSIRAFEIADECMLELLLASCIKADEVGNVLTLADDAGNEVSWMTEAAQATQDAVEWLAPREYVQLVECSDGEYVFVLRQPGG